MADKVKTKRPDEPLVGAHMSIAGGLWRAPGRLSEVGGNALQVFLKNNVQWHFGRLTEEDVEHFDTARREAGIRAVVAHACYLVNAATPDRRIRRKSLACLKKELEYAGRYGIEWLVLHPGNHMGAGVERGIDRVAAALRESLDAADDGVGVLIETTAGSGTAVGATFEEIAAIIEKAGGDGRLGVCLDTSHVFAAGYDIASEAGYVGVKRKLKKLGLIKRIRVIHVNDSKVGLGARTDRHEHIGKGRIGREAFGRIMRDRDFARVPKILETPKGACRRRACDAVNIGLLKRLSKKKS